MLQVGKKGKERLRFTYVPTKSRMSYADWGVLALTKHLDDGHEGKKAEEEGVEFLESREDAAVAFEPAQETFDLLTFCRFR
jgi:hypothetical protein